MGSNDTTRRTRLLIRLAPLELARMRRKSAGARARFQVLQTARALDREGHVQDLTRATLDWSPGSFTNRSHPAGRSQAKLGIGSRLHAHDDLFEASQCFCESAVGMRCRQNTAHIGCGAVEWHPE